MKAYYPRFVCPECSCEQLIEVRHAVKETIAAVKSPDHGEEIIYDKRFIHAVEPEDIDYRCLECGYVPKNEAGKVVCGTEFLAAWLLTQAEARIADIKFTCPTCGGHQFDDTAEIDDEGFCSRVFCCHDCGEEIYDGDELGLRKLLNWGEKIVEKNRPQ